MFHWQLIVLFIVVMTTISMAWPLEDDSKICFQLSCSGNADAKCAAYCKTKKGKSGGSCNKKRCVCNNKQSDEDKETKTKDRKLSFFTKPIADIRSESCQLYCKEMGQLDGSHINGSCVCSRS
jgi:hypothetical protein